MRSHTPLALVVVLAVSGSTGCMSWSRQGPTTEAAIMRMRPTQRVRVTQWEQPHIFLTNTELRADRLWGLQAGGTPTRDSTSLPLSRIVMVETRKFDFRRTLRAVAIGAGVVLLATLAVAAKALSELNGKEVPY